MKYIFSLLIAVSLFSCSDNEKNKAGNNDQTASISSKNISDNKFAAFAVPSPTMIAAGFKLYDLGYDESLLSFSNNIKPAYTLSSEKAINLGISLVDLGYATLYNQNQAIIKAVSKVRIFTDELNIENQTIIDMTMRFEENLNNQDSLLNLLNGVQSGIDKYYISEEQHELALLVLYGIYIEGLYFTTEYFKHIDKKNFNQQYYDVLSQMLFQQKIHLSGLLDLMEIYNSDQTYAQTLNSIREIQEIFGQMSFAYDMDKENRHIQKVNFRRKYLPLLQEKVSEVRKDILSS